MSGSDHREIHRVHARVLISCLTIDADGSPRLLNVRPADLSAGGMSVVADSRLELNQRMRLSVQVGDPPPSSSSWMPSSPDRAAAGRSVHVGLKFRGLDPERERRLVQAVFAHEQENVARHSHARMTVWEAVTIATPTASSRPDARSPSRPTTCGS